MGFFTNHPRPAVRHRRREDRGPTRHRVRAECRRRADRRGAVTRRRCAFVRRPPPRVRPRAPPGLLAARAERQARFDAGERPDFLDRDPSGPGPSVDGRTRAQGPRRPAGRDHRAGRAQDDDQRPQLGRPRLHGRLRGRRSRPRGPTWSTASATCATPSGAPSRSRRPTAAATSWPRRRPRWSCGPGAGTSTSTHVLVDGRPASASLLRLRAGLLPQRPRAARPRVGPVLLPAQAGEPPRGPALERRLPGRPGRASASRPGRSRPPSSSRRSPPRSRWTRSSTSCASTSPGLNAGRWDYIFSFIKKFRAHPGLRAARPRAGDHDRPVHAGLHRAAGARPATGGAPTPWAAWPRSSRTAAIPR